MASSTQLMKRMHDHYGRDYVHTCKQCCNCQLKERLGSTKICIAYSNSTPWNPNATACEKLFNVPFLALRPLRRPLEEVFDKPDSCTPGIEQTSIF